MSTELLITTNGFAGTWSAIEYGAWLAGALRMKITLLGVAENLSPAAIDDHHPLEAVVERAVSLFKQMGVEYSLEVQNGDAEQVIPEKANRGDYITVVSRLGRPQLKRWRTGRSIRYLRELIQGSAAGSCSPVTSSAPGWSGGSVRATARRRQRTSPRCWSGSRAAPSSPKTGKPAAWRDRVSTIRGRGTSASTCATTVTPLERRTRPARPTRSWTPAAPAWASRSSPGSDTPASDAPASGARALNHPPRPSR